VGRVRTNIIIDGHPCWTLFDTGARNTYVVSDIVDSLTKKMLAKSERVAIGGKTNQYDQICSLRSPTASPYGIVTALVEGKPVWMSSCILDEIGKDEEGKRIEVLFGALAMQRWGIRPVPDEERLDMTHYPEEFVEYVLI
jgi:hypothetical protein